VTFSFCSQDGYLGETMLKKYIEFEWLGIWMPDLYLVDEMHPDEIARYAESIFPGRRYREVWQLE
jgi:hypothetical protein